MPSEIAYTPSGVKWGFGIPQREPRLAWFKLLLDPTKYSLATINNSPLSKTKQLIPRGKKPVDVVADYLFELYKQTIDHLEKTLGKEVVEVSPLDFILTVPAVTYLLLFITCFHQAYYPIGVERRSEEPNHSSGGKGKVWKDEIHSPNFRAGSGCRQLLERNRAE